MAYATLDPVLTAIRDVVESGHGSARTITANTYDGGIYDSFGRDAESTAAVTKPRCEASITGVEPHKASHNVMGSTLLRSVTVEVRLVRHLNLEHATSNSLRDDVKALAARDGDVLSQALGYPSNLTTTAAATATNLVSGCLIYQSSKVGKAEIDAKGGGLIETVHSFTGVVKVTP